MPWLWIVLGILGLLTWWLGWIVIALAPVLVLLITLGVIVHDKSLHDTRCRWCNRVKAIVAEDRGIDVSRVRTKHLEVHPTYMQVQVHVDGMPDVRVDIDFNEEVLRTQAWPYTDRTPIDG